MKIPCTILIASMMFTLSLQLPRRSSAQTKSEPVTIVSHVDILPDAYKPQSEENAARLLRAQTAATQHDAGLLSYSVLQQTGASNHFTIVETWADNRSYEFHQGADHTVTFRREIQPFLGSPFDSREHHLFR